MVKINANKLSHMQYLVLEGWMVRNKMIKGACHVPAMLGTDYAGVHGTSEAQQVGRLNSLYSIRFQ